MFVVAVSLRQVVIGLLAIIPIGLIGVLYVEFFYSPEEHKAKMATNAELREERYEAKRVNAAIATLPKLRKKLEYMESVVIADQKRISEIEAKLQTENARKFKQLKINLEAEKAMLMEKIATQRQANSEMSSKISSIEKLDVES